MRPSFFPTSSLFFATIVLISTLIHVPTYLCGADIQYVTCGEPFQCANIQNIGYPFWGQSRPENCGHPDFQLQNCQGDAPLISIQSNPYRVLTINNTKQTLTVAREDLWNNLCPTNLYDTTLNYSHFSYTPNQTVLALKYGCIAGAQQPPNRFNCSLNGSSTNGVNYFMIANNGGGGNPLTCNRNIIVVVNETSGQALAKSSASTSDLIEALNGGFGLRWLANNSICNRCVESGGRCGSNSTSNSFACYCADQPYSLTCDHVSLPGSKKGLNHKMKLASVLLSMLGFISMLFVTIWCLKRRGLSVKAMFFYKKGSMNDQKVEALLRDPRYPTPKRYSYTDIKKMTNSFEDKLGQGGYGDVYKGKLSGGFLVAVKVLSEAKGEGDEFINEVASISRTSHVNVVALLGFCFEGSKRALIYEFMPNKSLDKFICNDCHRLDWKTLYQIAVGVAQGLEYLHRGCNTRIVHFDIKPHNILLDEDFCPKISDFGLSKLCKKKESIVSMPCARGTPGYIAPEVFCKNFGGVSNKSDVYSYGMMVLDMVGARENPEVGEARTSEIYFPDWIYEHLEQGNDLRHYGVTTEEEGEISRKMILTSLWCIQTNPSDRPSMSKVVEMWEGSLESLQIPPKPYVFSPMRPAQDSFASLSQSCETIVELTTSVHQ